MALGFPHSWFFCNIYIYRMLGYELVPQIVNIIFLWLPKYLPANDRILIIAKLPYYYYIMTMGWISHILVPIYLHRTALFLDTVSAPFSCGRVRLLLVQGPGSLVSNRKCWEFTGFTLWWTNITIYNYGKSHYFDWAIFNSKLFVTRVYGFFPLRDSWPWFAGAQCTL